MSSIRATGIHTPPTAWTSDADPFFPFIDTFGQYRHKDWPGKAHIPCRPARHRREAEAKELAAQPGPKDWDKYGGWAAGPRLQASGFFRTEKVKGKWWLVDPDGRLFFSHGIDCVRMTGHDAHRGAGGLVRRLPRCSSPSSSCDFLSQRQRSQGPLCRALAGMFLLRRRQSEAQVRPGMETGLCRHVSTSACAVGASTPSPIGRTRMCSCCAARHTPTTREHMEPA